MKKSEYIFTLSVMLLFLSCEKAEVSHKIKYAEKANELITQVIKDNPCGCVVELQKLSALQEIKYERPGLYKTFRKYAMENLELKDTLTIDSLDRLSVDYVLDKKFLEMNNVKLLPKDMLNLKTRSLQTISKMCPEIILSISKPIFSKDYKSATIDINDPFTCLPRFSTGYKYKNGKWVEKTAGNSA